MPIVAVVRVYNDPKATVAHRLVTTMVVVREDTDAKTTNVRRKAAHAPMLRVPPTMTVALERVASRESVVAPARIYTKIAVQPRPVNRG